MVYNKTLLYHNDAHVQKPIVSEENNKRRKRSHEQSKAVENRIRIEL